MESRSLPDASRRLCAGSNGARFSYLPPTELARVKAQLDDLHMQQVVLDDAAIMLKVGSFIGASTRRERGHALDPGKHVRNQEPIDA
jgi:hypothetical protein